MAQDKRTDDYLTGKIRMSTDSPIIEAHHLNLFYGKFQALIDIDLRSATAYHSLDRDLPAVVNRRWCVCSIA